MGNDMINNEHPASGQPLPGAECPSCMACGEERHERDEHCDSCGTDWPKRLTRESEIWIRQLAANHSRHEPAALRDCLYEIESLRTELHELTHGSGEQRRLLLSALREAGAEGATSVVDPNRIAITLEDARWILERGPG